MAAKILSCFATGYRPVLTRKTLGFLLELLDKNEIVKRSAKSALIVYATIAIQYVTSVGTQVVLARLLTPEVFGELAFVVMVSMFFNNFVCTHGTKYFIQSQGDVNETLDNVFTFELILSVAVALAILVSAPTLSNMLGKNEITRPLQFLVLTYFANPFSVPLATFERDLLFFQSRLPQIVGQISGSVVGIVLAYMGFGIWSLLWMRVAYLFSQAIVIWSISSYRPKLNFNNRTVKNIIVFGWPLAVASLFTYFSWNIDYYIVGSLLDNVQLGYYWLAFQMSHYFLQAKTALNSIFFPAFSMMGETNDRIRSFEFILKATSAVYTLLALLIITMGDKLIPFVFGEKWGPAIVPFQIFSVVILIRAVGGSAMPLLYSLGKTKQDLVVAVLSAVVLTLLVYPLTLLYGIKGAAIGVTLTTLGVAFGGFYFYIKPVSQHGFTYYIRDSAIIMAFTIIASVIVKWQFNYGLMFLVPLFFGILSYYLLFRKTLKFLFVKTQSALKQSF